MIAVSARQLQHVLSDCKKAFTECRLLATDAHRWTVPGGGPHISRKQRDWIIELAFLRAFLAMESFLEESFLLYSVGQKPRKGRAPVRYTFPPTKNDAMEWIKEGREYPSWAPTVVAQRAKRFFRDGRPFTSALVTSQSSLDEARTIRNAIAHDSAGAQDKFESLVRQKLATFPSGMTVGSFLNTTDHSAAPPQSFLERYIGRLEFVVGQIVHL
jgi:hypothetical protein